MGNQDSVHFSQFVFVFVVCLCDLVNISEIDFFGQAILITFLDHMKIILYYIQIGTK